MQFVVVRHYEWNRIYDRVRPLVDNNLVEVRSPSNSFFWRNLGCLNFLRADRSLCYIQLRRRGDERDRRGP